MRYLLFSVLIVLAIGLFAAPQAFAYSGGGSPPETDGGIPAWIKHIAGYWHDEKIPDETFLSAIQWLVNNGIIIVTPTDSESDSSATIPAWVKNTAGWWANDQIDDQTFLNAIQYLVDIGLIPVSSDGYVPSGY
tara:strand:- start:1 stop:402 length:402 start_codon:yes stop_codon:yes gene_type:complete